MNGLLLDGVSNSPLAGNGFLSYAALPSPDALQEFKVQTNSYAGRLGSPACSATSWPHRSHLGAGKTVDTTGRITWPLLFFFAASTPLFNGKNLDGWKLLADGALLAPPR